MDIKHIVVSTTLLVAAVSAFADSTAAPFSYKMPVKASNIIPTGQALAPSPSLIYFSDASYPVQATTKSNVTRAEVKADMIQSEGKSQITR